MNPIPRNKVKELIDNRPEGVTPEDVVGGLLSRGYQLEGMKQTEPEPGLLKGFSQALTKPFAKTARSGVEAVKALTDVKTTIGEFASAPFRKDFSIGDAARRGDERFKEGEERRSEEQDWGWFGGKVRPIGFDEEGAMSKGRAVADATGTALEIGSYAFPFISKGAGFFKTAISAVGSKPALTFGIGTGLQEFAKTDSTGEGVKRGLTDTIGAAIGFATFNKGGQLFSKFGSRLLKNEAVQQMAQSTKQFQEQTFNVMKDWFQAPRATLDDIATSQSLKETYDVLNTQFNRNLYENTEAIIGSLKQDALKDPEVLMINLSRNVASEVDGFFKLSERTYRSADNTGFTWDNFNPVFEKYSPAEVKISVDDLIQKAPLQENMINSYSKSGLTPRQIADELEIEIDPESTRFDAFITDIFDKLKEGGMRASDVFNNAYRLLGIGRADRTVKSFTPEEQAVARDLAFSIFDQMEQEVKRAGRQDVLDIISKGRSQWQQALKINNSNVLNNLKESGSIDNFLSKVIDGSGKLTKNEVKTLDKVLTQNPEETQELFMNGIVDRLERLIRPARGQMPTPETLAEGAKFIDNFLEKKGTLPWSDYIISTQNREYLRNLSDFMKTNFDDLLNRMKELSGVVPEEEQMLMDMMVTKGRLDLSEALKGKDFTEFSESFLNLLEKHPTDVAPFIRQMRPQEKQVAGLAVLNKMYDEALPLFVPDETGKYVFDDGFTQAMKDSHARLKKLTIRAKDDTLYGLFDKQMVKDMDAAIETVTRMEAIEQIDPPNIGKFIDALAGSFYVYRQWWPGAMARYERALRKDPEFEKQAKEMLYEEVSKIANQNGLITVGDLIQSMAKFPPFPIGASQAVINPEE